MAETDFSAIEAEERARIISELSFHLETRQNCKQTLSWDDSGSGADLDGYFFIPQASKTEYIIGGHASGKRSSKYHCVTTVSEAANNPKDAPAILVKPADWKQVWKDSGSGAVKDGSFWHAIPPDSNYKCIGSVSQLMHNQKPDLHNYRCVHKSLTDKITTTAVVWSDKGTGAAQQVTMFNLPVTGTYIAVASRVSKVETYELKKNASSVPDPKMVEEILAKRMAPLKADVAAKTKAAQEQKADAKAAAEQVAAKKAKQKKIAAEKKKQATLAAQEQEEDGTEEAQRLKEQQQAHVAKAMEKKAAAEKAKQKEIMAKQVQEEKTSKDKANKEEIQSETVIEEVVEITEAAEPSDDIVSEPKNESKGISSIMSFFLKVLGLLVGGVVVLMIAFKALFGKKETK